MIKENTISRPRLVSLLKKNLNKKLILIIADAGYGKTTLVTQFLFQKRPPYVFYDLETNDQCLSAFLFYLIEAIGKLQTGLGERTRTLLLHLENITSHIEMVMGTLINEIVEKRKEQMFIILDDLHTIPEASFIYQALDYFIEHLPSNVHVIISSRTSPPLLSLARWRSKQDVFELTREDLRFTEKEIKSLLKNIYKTTLGSEELKELVLHTEGWSTGLQMILQHTGAERIKKSLNSYLESNVPLFDYFANEILRNETKKRKEFLLKSSLLEYLSPDACCAVTTIENSNEVLKSLVQNNLFTTLVSSRPRIYKYHYLFREFLKHELSKVVSSKELRNLHMNAAKFYIKKRIWDRAIHHLIESMAYEQTAMIIEKIGADLVYSGRVNLLYHWLESLPDKTVTARPRLLIYKAKILQQWGKWDESLEFFMKARRIFHGTGKQSGEAEALFNISSICYNRGIYKKAIRLAKEAIDLIEDTDNCLKAKLLNQLAGAYYSLYDYELVEQTLKKALFLCHRFHYPKLLVQTKANLAALYYATGKISQALDIYRYLLQSNNFVHNNPPLAITCYCNSAEIYLARGEFESAREPLEKALQLGKEINYKEGQSYALAITGNFYRLAGDYENALNFYNQALELNVDMKQEYINHIILFGMAQCYQLKGELDKAEEFVKSCLTAEQKDELFMASLSLVLGEIALRHNQYEKAEEIFLQSHRVFQKKGPEYNRMLNHFQLANLYWARRNTTKMKEHLKQAIAIAKQERYDGFLIDEINRNPRILGWIRNENIDDAYISVIAKRIQRSNYLEISMLGTFQVKTSGILVTSKMWKTRKAKSIAAYLFAHRNEITTRDCLLDIYFSNYGPKKAAHNLVTSLHFIKKAIGENILIYQRGGYCINSKASVSYDVDEFLQMVQIGDKYKTEKNNEESVKQYLKAVEIYKGDYLEDIYDNWCETSREYYRSIYLRILTLLGEYFYSRGEYEQSMKYYHMMLEKDKYMEDAHCGIMKCYSQVGNRKGVVQQFQKLVTVLQNELGLEPLPETKKLYNRLIQ